VLIPNPDDGGLVAQRVVAISVKQQDRQVLYTPELSAVLKSREQRQAQTLTSMLGGTLGGRVSNASPVRLPTRVTAAVAGAASSNGAVQRQTGYIASSQTFGGLSVTSVTATVPSARQAGDLLVAVVGRMATMNAPSDWNLAARVTSSLNSNQLAVFYKISDGTETTATFTTTGSADALCAIIGVYRGVDTSNPIAAINAAGVESETSSYVFPAPTVPAPGGRPVVYGVMHDSSASNEANGDGINADGSVALREYLSNATNFRYSMVLCDEGSPTDPSTVRDFSDPTADSWTDHTWKGVTLALNMTTPGSTPSSPATSPLFADDLSGTPVSADSGDDWLYPDA